MQEHKPPALPESSLAAMIEHHFEVMKKARLTYVNSQSSAHIRRSLSNSAKWSSDAKYTIGDLVYFKKSGDYQWYGPALVMCTDGPIVLIRHGFDWVRVHDSRLKLIQDECGTDNKRKEENLLMICTPVKTVSEIIMPYNTDISNSHTDVEVLSNPSKVYVNEAETPYSHTTKESMLDDKVYRRIDDYIVQRIEEEIERRNKEIDREMQLRVDKLIEEIECRIKKTLDEITQHKELAMSSRTSFMNPHWKLNPAVKARSGSLVAPSIITIPTSISSGKHDCG